MKRKSTTPAKKTPKVSFVFSRSNLLQTLQDLSNILAKQKSSADSDSTRELESKFTFDNRTVTVFNGIQYCQVPIRTPLHGEVPSDILISMLKAYGAEKVKISSKDSVLTLSTVDDTMKTRLNYFERKDGLVSDQVKRPTDVNQIVVKQNFLHALSYASSLVDEKTLETNRRGITLDYMNNRAYVFSTNRISVRRASFDTVDWDPAKVELPIIIPVRFASMLAHLIEPEQEDITLNIENNGSSIFVEAETGAYIQSQLIDASNTVPYAQMLGDFNINNIERAIFPEQLGSVIERVNVLARSERERSSARVTLHLSAETIGVEYQSDAGELKETIKIPEGKLKLPGTESVTNSMFVSALLSICKSHPEQFAYVTKPGKMSVMLFFRGGWCHIAACS